MTTKNTIEKAYGNVPKDVGYSLDFGFIPTWRGVKYYWIRFVRQFTR